MKKIIKFVQKKPVIFVLLLLIILTGLWVRAYHIDYPVVGYHNWKETHYLSEARNFAEDGFFEHGFFIPENDYPLLNGDPSGVHTDTFPTISIITAVAFKIFGTSLATARIIGILFSLGAILGMFLMVKQLFKRDDVALTAAAITAILPLFVFFSHNVQLMNPGLFFMLFGAYYYLKWLDKETKQNIFWVSVWISLAVLTKFTYLIIIIPLLLVTPIKTTKKVVGNIKNYLVPILIFSTIPIWILYSSFASAAKMGGRTFQISSLINLSALQTVSWWASVKAYTLDNYTGFGLLFTIVGLWAAFYFYRKNEGIAEKFIMSYGFSVLLFVLIASEKLGGHSYHQFPIAPFFVISIAYSFMVISSTVSNMLSSAVTKNKEFILNGLKIFVVLLLLIVFYKGGADASIERQFDVQFVGLDIAGEYINANSGVNERIIYPGGQSFGVLWHADRKGYYNLKSVEEIKKAESLGAKWIFLYAWGLADINNPEKWDYITSNYHLEQVAFQDRGNKNPDILYLLLKKGGSFDMDGLQEFASTRPSLSREYEFSTESVKIHYINA